MRNRTRQTALTGMLFALAILFSIVEGAVSPAFGLPPGIKLGLANIVVLYCLLFLTAKQGLLLVVLKAGFVFITRGGLAGGISLAGGLLSLLAMMVLLYLDKGASLVLISVVGALFHNIGQLGAFSLWFGAFAWVYLPILLVAAVGMGALTATLLKILLPHMKKAGLLERKNRDARKEKPAE